MINTLLRPIRQTIMVEVKILYVAASDVGPKASDYFDYDFMCDGDHDEAEINYALGILEDGGGHAAAYTYWCWRWPWKPAAVYEKGCPELKLSYGTFYLRGDLIIPRGVAERGESADKTRLYCDMVRQDGYNGDLAGLSIEGNK